MDELCGCEGGKSEALTGGEEIGGGFQRKQRDFIFR